AAALARDRARLPRPCAERASVAAAGLPRPGGSAPGLGARRQGQRRHRARRGRGPGHGPDRAAGGGAGRERRRAGVAGRAHPGGGAPHLPAGGPPHAGGAAAPRRTAPGGRMRTPAEAFAYLTKGCVDVVTADALRAKLALGRPLTVKVGFDPTAPDLHLGHTVLIRKMKHFQDLGHRVSSLIGAFPGMIGDPTGRSKTRPALSVEDIANNAETYKAQVFKILDPVKTEIRFNREWLGALGSDGLIRLAATYNVARMLERRDFRQRYDAGAPISVHEFLYPLAQAYDSVFLKADVELGGSDQLFNLNVAPDIMPAFGRGPW